MTRRRLFVLFVSGFTGLCLVRCKSLPVAESIAEQRVENRAAVEVAKRSNLPPKEKEQVVNALDNSSKKLTECGQDNANLKADLTAAEWYEGAFWKLVIGNAVFILGFLVYLFKFRRSQ